MIQTKLFSIYPPFNNLIYWVENYSEDISELHNLYYELIETLNNSKKEKILVQKSTSLGEMNKMQITFWRNMN